MSLADAFYSYDVMSFKSLYSDGLKLFSKKKIRAALFNDVLEYNNKYYKRKGAK